MSSLKKELSDFNKRMVANVSVTAEIADSRKRNNESIADNKTSKLKRMKVDTLTKDNYASVSGSSTNNFAVLAKIINHLKHRHQRNYHHPLTLEEILDETKQYDVSARIKHWLEEALPNNVKVEVTEDKKYIYKPEFTLRGPTALSRLLQRQFADEIGAISLDSIEESLPNFRKVLQNLSSSILIIARPDKKEFVFSRVVGMETPITDDDCFKKFWRSSSVEGLSETKISEFLQQHNIHTSGMSENNQFKAPKIKTKNKRNSKRTKELKHNAHVAGDIIDYERD